MFIFIFQTIWLFIDDLAGKGLDIVIIGNREKIKKELIRNSRGIIFLDLEDSSKLSISLRSQAFNFNQYKRTIDTSFTELLGKR